MGALITVSLIAVLIMICRVPVPSASNDAVMLVLGGLLSRMGDIYAYYFGSSEGSQRKTEILGGANATQPPPAP